MKFKLKVVPIVLSLALSSTSITAFADEFNPQVAFSNYKSFTQLKEYNNYYKVTKTGEKNSYAIFKQNEQITDFIYNKISYIENVGFIVSQDIDGIENYGLINQIYVYDEDKNIKEPKYTLPIKYKNIECQEIREMNVYIAEKFDGNKEYYLDKGEFNSCKEKYGDNGTFNIAYEDCGEALRISSLDNVPKGYKETNIKGLDGVYIKRTPMQNYLIVDKDGNKLVDTEFREVDNKLSPGGTLVVRYPVGMGDSSLMVLNKDLEVIVPDNYYGLDPTFLESNGQIYIKVQQVIVSSEVHYYDLQGNKLDKEPPNANVVTEYVEDNQNNQNKPQPPNQNNKRTAIEGLNGVYFEPTVMEDYVIVDKDGNKLLDTEFRSINYHLSPGNTLIVRYPMGHTDSSLMILNENLEIIVPENYYGLYPEFLESSGQIYIKVKQVIGSDETHYYDLLGNRLQKIPSDAKPIFSSWAEEEIYKANKLNIVPKHLQSNYTNKITRQEFCQLAVQTYITKTGKNIDMNAKSPFIDVNDHYITTAYNLKIVSGTSKDKFSPNNYITRQEAAVMVNNLAKLMNINSNVTNKEKFVDEKYFASWAKSSIYSVSNIKSGNVYVMTGTGNGKFSPWFNYTKEQAISTMLRLYELK